MHTERPGELIAYYKIARKDFLFLNHCKFFFKIVFEPCLDPGVCRSLQMGAGSIV